MEKMESVKVPVVLRDGAVLPKYATDGSAGMDLCAAHDCVVYSRSTVCVSTGLRVAVPEGYELQIRSRSGLALKRDVFVLNSPGTVDSDYRGVVGVILHNASRTPFVIHAGDRIAQAVLAPVVHCMWDEVDDLDFTVRGDGGFGSTGID